jgi:hypothetical protein
MSSDLRIDATQGSESQARAMKRLLKRAGARRVTVLDGGAVHAKFKTPEALQKAKRDWLEPLEALFQNQKTDAPSQSVVVPRARFAV